MVDYKELKEVDLRLCLLSGRGIKVENLVIKPYTLDEIQAYGYTNYMKNLQWLSITVDDFISSVEDEDKRIILEEQRANLKTYDFYTKLGGREFSSKLLEIISMIFRTEDVRFLDDGVIAIDFIKKGILVEDENGDIVANNEKLNTLSEDEITIVHKDNFDNIVEVIKFQNYLKKAEKKEVVENPVDDETRRLMEDMERHRKKVEAKKQAQKKAELADDEEVDIADIVSAVSSKSHSLNKLNIWEFTLYQIYDEYARLELIDNYDFSIKAMMAGAENIDLKHWSSKL